MAASLPLSPAQLLGKWLPAPGAGTQNTRALPPSRLCVDGGFIVNVFRGVYGKGLSSGATKPAQESSFMSP